MADGNSSPPNQSRVQAGEHPSSVEPLTRRGYKRTTATQRQIAQAAGLDSAALLEQAQQRDESAKGFLSAEALVYFVRRADSAEDSTTRDALIREILERCTVFFRGQFGGRSKEEREDLQETVICKLVEDLLDPGGRSDFMEMRFWRYLKRKCIDARRSSTWQSSGTESLDESLYDENESNGQSKLDAHEDVRLGPQQVTMLSDALETLSPDLRRVYLLRHYVGMKIGADNPADDPPNEMTLAQHFDCSGRTIRNWLKKADRLLAGFRET